MRLSRLIVTVISVFVISREATDVCIFSAVVGIGAGN